LRANKRKLIISALGIVLLLLVILITFHKNPTETVTMPLPTETVKVEPIIIKDKVLTYEEARSWPKVGDSFATNTNTALVIFLSKDKLLYVYNNQLYRLNFGLQPVSLYTWESETEAKVWHIGDGFLIGSKQGETAVWQYAHPLKQKDEYFEYRSYSQLTYGPEQVLEIKYCANPELVFLTFKVETTFDEYVINVNNFQFDSIHLEINADPGNYYEHPYFSHQQEKVKDVTTIQPISNWEGKMYSFEDKRGTILFAKSYGATVYRYGDLKIVDMKYIQQEVNDPQLYIHFKDDSDKEHILKYGQMGFYPFIEKICHENWTAFRPNAFYHLDSKVIETVSYECQVCMINPITSKKYSLDSLKFIEKSGPLLTFIQKENHVFLSLYDITRYNTNNSKAPDELDSLLMTELKPVDTTIAEKPFPGNEDGTKIMVELPEMILSERNTNKPLPNEVVKVIQDKFFSGSGDGNQSALYRKIGTEWYILIDNLLYVYKNDNIVLVGTLPIKTTIWITNYSINLGAQDFTKSNGYWYIADTVGNRILKLDQKLKIINELALPSPSSIQIVDKDQLEAISLKGKSKLNQQLELLNSTDVTNKKIPDKQIVSRELSNYDVNPASYYVDQATKLTWYFQWPGYLNLYRSDIKEQRSYYVGLMFNGRGIPRIMPYQDKMILLFDNRAHIFQRDGKWLKTIDFPRGKPDGIYVDTTDGENSLYFDENNNVIYLVQGYRIIAVNLITNEVKTLFQQNNTNIGKMIYSQGKLYFTLQPIEHKFKDENTQEDALTELCKLEITSGKLTRYLVRGDWSTDKIEKGALVLWSYKPSMYMSYLLQSLK
jgi:hypothetical protein